MSAATESGDFCYDREIWGPTPAQQRYDTRRSRQHCGATINLGTASIWMGASPGASRREGVARPEGRSWRRREPT
ncbi:hypothetical protein C3L21_22750 (plasmid) [Sinorhizobium meliloti]|nr:hypothetical protein C3L21_22750 [Sinorhizobium meliloti]